jgi:hypothetical protein
MFNKEDTLTLPSLAGHHATTSQPYHKLLVII